MTERAAVGQRAARAAVWAFLSTAGAKLITLVALVVLARILAPRDFGLLAFALVYMTYAETIGDLGSGVALVYWPNRREDAAQVTFFINLAAGTFWCILTILLAPAIASFFNSPNGTGIVRALAFGFLIKYLGNTHDALAQKDLRFRARAIPELGLAALKAGISIALAWRGFGAWSLVWGHLAGLACWTALLWIVVPWRPSFALPTDLVGPMLRYGRGIITVNVIASVVHHADLAIVGRMLGVTALGLYQIAQKIPEATVIVLLWVVSKVLFPAFSRLHAAGESLRRPYLLATRYVTAITFPAAIGLAFLAEPLVLLFFGPAWSASAPILSALAVYAGLRSVGNHAGDVLKATGRANVLARVAAVKAMVLIPVLIAGATRGPSAVAIALASVEAASGALILTIASRVIGVSLREIGRAFVPSAIAAAALAAFLAAWPRWIDVSPALEVSGAVVAGAAIYTSVLYLAAPSLFTWAKEKLLSRSARRDDLLTTP